jgi:Reverse transcriptase (RNA-dependent DNA polymerase)
MRQKGSYKSVEEIFVGYYDNLKAYKVWVPCTHTLLKVRDVVFDELNHIERVIIHRNDDDDDEHTLWSNDNRITITTKSIESKDFILLDQEDIIPPLIENELVVERGVKPEEVRVEDIDGGGDEEDRQSEEREAEVNQEESSEEEAAPKDFSRGPWMDPSNVEYGRGRRHALLSEAAAMAHGERDLEEMETAFVVLANDEPASYKEVMSSENAGEWRRACQAEYDTLMGYQTWTLVEKPSDVNVVGSRWTFRVKRDNLGELEKFKSRVVAQVFSQVPGIDFQETYSPTIRLTSIRFILALACKYDLKLRPVDVKGAYLNGKLDEPVYMHQPEGFIEPGEEHLVCKLNKGIYGLKQSGRVWHNTLRSELEKIGFKKWEVDKMVFFRFGEGREVDIVG